MSLTPALFEKKKKKKYSYVSASTAASERLAYVDPATNRAIVKVDNTSVVRAPEKRKSVRIMSKASFAPGSVWVADFWHVPFGVSGLCWVAWARCVLMLEMRSARYGRHGEHLC